MSQGEVSVTVHIHNTPETVMGYIADVRNRPFFLGPLKSVDIIQGEPDAVGTRWKWTWLALGMEFEGVGECVQYEPAKSYTFKTEGGIASTWTYLAEADGDGTKLTIKAEYEVPQSAVSRLPVASVAEKMKQGEAQRVADNLQIILNR